MKTLRTLILALVLGSLLGVGAKAQPNLLVAGDFEGITTGSFSGYWPPATGVWGRESAGLSTGANGIAPFGTQMLQINHAGGGGASQIAQIVQGPFTAGSVVTFTAKLNTWLAGQAVYLDILPQPTGVTVDGPRISSPLTTLDSNPSTWETVTSTTTLTANTNYIAVEIRYSQVSGALPFGTPLAYADDAVLTVAPRVVATVSTPVLVVPENISVPATSGAGAVVNFATSAASKVSMEIFRRTSVTAEPWKSYTKSFVSSRTGSFTLNFNVVSAAGGDNSVFIDAVDLSSGATSLLSDSFETPTLPNSSTVLADIGDTTVPVALGSNWYFTNYGGILRGPAASSWGSIANGIPPSGSQKAVLRDVVGKQTKMTSGTQVSLVAGQVYTLDFDQASREIFGGALTYTVTLDGVENVPVVATPYASGATFPIGTTTQNLTATNGAGVLATGSFSVTVAGLPTVIDSPTTASATYGTPFSYIITGTNSPTSFTATGLPSGLTRTGAVISGTPTESGIFSVNLTASNSAGTSPQVTLLLTIDQANATVVVTPYNVPYDGNPHTATFTVAGVNGDTGAIIGTVNLNTTHTNAGSYSSDTWSFTGGANYKNIPSTPITNTITKASSKTVVTINGGPFTYTGAAQTPATVAVTGAGGRSLPAAASYANNINAGTATANGTFAGDDNHNPSSDSKDFTIGKAAATVTLGDLAPTYDGLPKAATATTSVAGLRVDLTYTLNGAAVVPTDPGSYAVTATVNDTNYAGSASGTLEITAVRPAITSISPNSVQGGGTSNVALTVIGTGFTTSSVVMFEDQALTTTFVSGLKLTAVIPPSSVPLPSEGIRVSRVWVKNEGAGAETSAPRPFVVLSPLVNSYQTEIAARGVRVSSSITLGYTLNSGDWNDWKNLFLSDLAAATAAATDYPVFTAASYSANPVSVAGAPSGLTDFADFQIIGAKPDAQGKMNYYYRSTITEDDEKNLVLWYFDGAKWVPASSDNTSYRITKDTTDNLDGTTSGGRFTVEISRTSKPAVTALAGTVFAVAINRAPVASAGPDQAVEAVSAGGATVALSGSGSADPDQDAITYEWRTGTTVLGTGVTLSRLWSIGSHTVTLTVTDAFGLTGTDTVIVNVRDTTAPALTVPANIVTEATSGAGAAVSYPAPTATDAVGVTSLTSTPASGSIFALGSTAVTATARDAAGNAGTGSFTVTVRDTTPPAIGAVPTVALVEATGPGGATVSFAVPTATDLVDGTVAVTASPASGSTFAIGNSTVTLSARDTRNNDASKTFTVTVRDSTPPVITVPANIVAEATGSAGAVVTFATGASDLVDGAVATTAVPASGSTFARGTTTVTVSATDARGNTASKSFTVTVRDTTAPTITSVSTNAPTLWPPNHKMVAVTVSATATDLVGVASLKIIGVTSNEPDNGLGDGDTANDIEITGNLTVNLRAERSGNGNGRIYTITVEAKDAAGNASTKTVTVLVPKNQGK